MNNFKLAPTKYIKVCSSEMLFNSYALFGCSYGRLINWVLGFFCPLTLFLAGTSIFYTVWQF